MLQSPVRHHGRPAATPSRTASSPAAGSRPMTPRTATAPPTATDDGDSVLMTALQNASRATSRTPSVSGGGGGGGGGGPSSRAYDGTTLSGVNRTPTASEYPVQYQRGVNHSQQQQQQPAVDRSSFAALDDTNRQLAGSVTTLQSENSRLHQQASDASLRLQDTVRERAALVARMQEQADRFREREAAYLQEIDRLRGDCAELSDVKERALATVDREREEATTRQSESTAWAIDKERLKAALKQSEARLAKVEELSKQRAEQLAAASVAKVKLERQLGKAKSEAAGAGANADQEVKIAHDRAQEALSKLGTAQDVLRTARDELSQTQARLQAKEHQVSVLSESNAQLKDDSARRESQLLALQAQTQEQEQKLAQLESLRDERLRSVLDETGQQVDSVRRMMQERAEVHNKSLREKQEAIDELSTKVARLQRENAELEGAVSGNGDERKKLSDELYKAQNEVKMLQSQVGTRGQDLASVRDRASDLEVQLKTAEARADHSEKAGAEARAEIERLEAQLREVKAQLGTALGAGEWSASVAARFAGQLNEKNDDIEELSEKLRRAESARREQNDKASDLEHERTTLQRKMAKIEAAKQEVDWELARLQETFDARLASVKSDSESTLVVHRSEVEKLRAAHQSDLEAAELNFGTRQRALEAKNEALEERLRAQEQQTELEVARAIERHDAKRDEVEERKFKDIESTHHSHITDLRAANEQEQNKLRKALDASRERNEELAGTVESCHERIDGLMLALRSAEQERLNVSTVEREEHRSRELTVVQQVREAEDRAAKAEIAATERLRVQEESHWKQLQELKTSHEDAERRWRREQHESSMNQLASADTIERREASARLAAQHWETAHDALFDRSMHLLFSAEQGTRSEVATQEQRAREAIVAKRTIPPLRRSALCADSIADFAGEALQEAESRCRGSLDLLAVIGAEALNIMSAYHRLRDEHDTLVENMGVKARERDARAKAEEQRLRGKIRTLQEELEVATGAQVDILTPERENRGTQSEPRARDGAATQTQAQASTTPPPEPAYYQRAPSPTSNAAMQTARQEPPVDYEAAVATAAASRDRALAMLAKSEDANHGLKERLAQCQQQYSDICGSARELHVKVSAAHSHVRDTFQSDSWRRAVHSGGIDDDLGLELCRIVESVQWIAEQSNGMSHRHGFDGPLTERESPTRRRVGSPAAQQQRRRPAAEALMTPRQGQSDHRSALVARTPGSPPPPYPISPEELTRAGLASPPRRGGGAGAVDANTLVGAGGFATAAGVRGSVAVPSPRRRADGYDAPGAADYASSRGALRSPPPAHRRQPPAEDDFTASARHVDAAAAESRYRYEHPSPPQHPRHFHHEQRRYE